MRLPAFIIVLIACAFARADTDVDHCRRMLTHVVEKHGAMSSDDLHDFALRPTGTNPIEFATFKNETTYHAYGQVFAAYLRGPEREAIGQMLRVEALRLAAAKRRDEGRRDDAREETRGVVYPVVLRKLGEISIPNLFTHRGRKFVTFKHGDSRIAQLDTATGDIQVSDPGIGSLYGSPKYFEHQNEGWFVLHGHAGVQTTSLSGAIAEIFPETAGTATYRAPIPLTFDGKVWLAVADDRGNQIVIEPAVPTKSETLRYPGIPSPQEFRISYGAKGPLLLTSDTTAGIFNLIDPSSTVPNVINVGSAGVQMQHYHRNGELRFLRTHGKSLTIRDAAQEVIHDHPLGSIRYPNLYLDEKQATVLAGTNTPAGLSLIDLDTHDLRHIPGAPANTTGFAYFRYRGHEYVTWGEQSGDVVIVDMANPTDQIRQKVTEYKPSIIVPYETPTGINAILVNTNVYGAVLQLIGVPGQAK